jgi:hypothetical protein
MTVARTSKVNQPSPRNAVNGCRAPSDRKDDVEQQYIRIEPLSLAQRGLGICGLPHTAKPALPSSCVASRRKLGLSSTTRTRIG